MDGRPSQDWVVSASKTYSASDINSLLRVFPILVREPVHSSGA